MDTVGVCFYLKVWIEACC